MVRELELKILPKDIDNHDFILTKASKKARWPKDQIEDWQIIRRSIDARGTRPFYLLRIRLSKAAPLAAAPRYLPELQMVDKSPSVIIIGAGPAGYFAALE